MSCDVSASTVAPTHAKAVVVGISLSTSTECSGERGSDEPAQTNHRRSKRGSTVTSVGHDTWIGRTNRGTQTKILRQTGSVTDGDIKSLMWRNARVLRSCTPAHDRITPLPSCPARSSGLRMVVPPTLSCVCRNAQVLGNDHLAPHCLGGRELSEADRSDLGCDTRGGLMGSDGSPAGRSWKCRKFVTSDLPAQFEALR